jgi:hypothetical protein
MDPFTFGSIFEGTVRFDFFDGSPVLSGIAPLYRCFSGHVDHAPGMRLVRPTDFFDSANPKMWDIGMP